jgi:hypothetical protein
LLCVNAQYGVAILRVVWGCRTHGAVRILYTIGQPYDAGVQSPAAQRLTLSVTICLVPLDG